MKRAGYEVVEAIDGAAAIERATESPPDIVLMDVQLPDMDGYTVAVRMREMPALLETPIIAVTSFAFTGDEERARQAGCTAYIAKPLSPRLLLEKIRELIG